MTGQMNVSTSTLEWSKECPHVQETSFSSLIFLRKLNQLCWSRWRYFSPKILRTHLPSEQREEILWSWEPRASCWYHWTFCCCNSSKTTQLHKSYRIRISQVVELKTIHSIGNEWPALKETLDLTYNSLTLVYVAWNEKQQIRYFLKTSNQQGILVNPNANLALLVEKEAAEMFTVIGKYPSFVLQSYNVLEPCVVSHVSRMK